VLLAFDTATPAVTVALHDGVRVRAECTVVDARRHGELLGPGIAQVLGDAGVSASDLTKIAVGVGPGPFTGLRVGLVTARAMSDALRIPAVGVCTLDILAAAIVCEGSFLVATDARRREVYWAVYDENRRRLDGPNVGRSVDIEWRGPAFGAGALQYRADFGSAHEPKFPSAAALCAMVVEGSATILEPHPLYLRRPDAVEPGARKAVTPA
jgi:tRNA threonylcarbamoyl adenosine modification protein YeaZ